MFVCLKFILTFHFLFSHIHRHIYEFLNSLLELRLWVVQLSATRCHGVCCCLLIQSWWVSHPQLSMLPCLLRGVNSKHAKIPGSRLPWHQESYSWHLEYQRWLQGILFILTGKAHACILGNEATPPFKHQKRDNLQSVTGRLSFLIWICCVIFQAYSTY